MLDNGGLKRRQEGVFLNRRGRTTEAFTLFSLGLPNRGVMKPSEVPAVGTAEGVEHAGEESGTEVDSPLPLLWPEMDQLWRQGGGQLRGEHEAVFLSPPRPRRNQCLLQRCCPILKPVMLRAPAVPKCQLLYPEATKATSGVSSR